MTLLIVKIFLILFASFFSAHGIVKCWRDLKKKAFPSMEVRFEPRDRNAVEMKFTLNKPRVNPINKNCIDAMEKLCEELKGMYKELEKGKEKS